MEKMCTGRVVVLGPDMYVEITTSARERASAKRDAVKMEGANRGKIIVVTSCHIVEAKSRADSKMD